MPKMTKRITKTIPKTMTKVKREEHSTEALKSIVDDLKPNEYSTTERLYTCKAYYYHVRKFGKHFCVLVSYNTIVAYYDYDAKIFYDVLRPMYGYTATSAQHIAKFKRLFDISHEIRYE